MLPISERATGGELIHVANEQNRLTTAVVQEGAAGLTREAECHRGLE